MKKVQYRKILLTYDGSKLANAAIPHALSIASVYGSKVTLLYVIEPVGQEIANIQSAVLVTPVETIAGVAEEIVAAGKIKAEKQLNKIRSELEIGGIKLVRVKVVEGFADSKIVEVAKKEFCDLIVMSTHGRSGLGRVLLGSVADYVVRNASCPVLLVHPQ